MPEGKSTDEKSGRRELTIGCSLPVVTYIVGDIANLIVSQYSPAPNQGAAIIAGGAFIVSGILGLCFIASGSNLLARSRRKRKDQCREQQPESE